MGEVVALPVVRVEKSEGNGAREALISTAILPDGASLDDAKKWADWILSELWMRGFKVVPLG